MIETLLVSELWGAGLGQPGKPASRKSWLALGVKPEGIFPQFVKSARTSGGIKK